MVIHGYQTVLVTVMITAITISCKTQKALVGDQGKEKLEALPDQSNSLPELIGSDYKTAKITKIKGEFIFEGNVWEVRGNIGLYRDSLIIVSVIPALGYEIFRMFCTKDSILMINRQEQSYIAASMKTFQEKFNLPFSNGELQSILSGEAFLYQQGTKELEIEENVVDNQVNRIYYLRWYRRGTKIAEQRLTVDKKVNLLNENYIADYPSGMRMRSDYKLDLNGPVIRMPAGVNLTVSQRNYELRLKMDYGQITLNDSLRVDLEVPEGYTRKYL